MTLQSIVQLFVWAIIGSPELNAHYQRAIELICANVDALTQSICTKKETAYVA